MSRNIIKSFARSLPIASAALLINIGSAAAATPQSDFQSQVSAVLAGNVVTHAALQSNSTGNEAASSQVDAQQFARQLLQGWSVSHPVHGGSATQSQSAAQEDIQRTVQRFLTGQQTARDAS